MARLVGFKDNIKALTITELVGRFALNNQVEGKSPRTITWYSEMIAQFQKYLGSNGYLDNLSSLNINTTRDYVHYLRSRPRYEGHPHIQKRDRNLSPKTIQCHVRALRSFSRWLYSEGYTETNVLTNLRLPKAPAIMIEPISPGEIRLILATDNKDSATGVRNHAILETMLDTGLRVSEIAGITLSGLNLKDGYIKVMGKGSKERIVPIGKHVQMILFSYIDKTRPAPIKPSCNKLFLSRSGEPITPNTIKLMFSRLAKKSGVGRLHAHLCRHTFAINYLLNGGDIFSLKEILGHTTLEMVNHYLHFTSTQIVVQHHKYSPMDKLLIHTRRSTQARDLALTP
jgi:site-specific recombinase XerD